MPEPYTFFTLIAGKFLTYVIFMTPSLSPSYKDTALLMYFSNFLIH